MNAVWTIITIIIILCTSCTHNYNPIPSDIEPYVSEFEHHSKQYSKHIKLNKINFILQGNFTAHPNWSGYYYDGTVYLDTTSMHYRYNRRALVFHELGHAVLHRDHNDKMLNNGITGSIMNFLPSDFRPEHELYGYYVTELFMCK